MNESDPFDPYQTPASAASVIPETQSTGVLKDPRFLGNAALTAISIQVFLKALMAFVPRQSDIVMAVTIAHVTVFLGSVVFFLVWIHRCASNVMRINRHADVKPGWVVGSYFIPFVNWFAPCIHMRAIIRGTFLHHPAGALPSITIVWWIAYGLSNFVLRFDHGSVGLAVWSLSVMVSWIGVIILVTRISRRQAAFRWPEMAESQRALLRPLPPRSLPGRPPIRARRIQPVPAALKPNTTDVESG